MTDFIKSYLDLLIIQYRGLPNAESEIKAILKEFDSIFELYKSFDYKFDVDNAVGDQLDIIGKIVGLSRKVSESIPKKYFGFNDNPRSYPMGDKFISVVAYPFKDKFEVSYTDLELNDKLYRFFIKAKIAKNYAKNTIIEINNIIGLLFDGKAYVTDNENMTLLLYIDTSYDFDNIIIINRLNLLPKPQGVRYDYVISYNDGNTFGFNDNPDSLGFSDKFNTSINGGNFANKVIL